ncbi:uncharacterized protein LOC134786602 isoform X2 [Penaeus indicus]|uniref:uncharacterized protein LOC134786602 isoform X2 n=1 Tax=Penaeus indicus TaxID=29960 RepID=UPI00300C521D
MLAPLTFLLALTVACGTLGETPAASDVPGYFLNMLMWNGEASNRYHSSPLVPAALTAASSPLVASVKEFHLGASDIKEEGNWTYLSGHPAPSTRGAGWLASPTTAPTIRTASISASRAARRPTRPSTTSTATVRRTSCASSSSLRNGGHPTRSVSTCGLSAPSSCRHLWAVSSFFLSAPSFCQHLLSVSSLVLPAPSSAELTIELAKKEQTMLTLLCICTYSCFYEHSEMPLLCIINLKDHNFCRHVDVIYKFKEIF